jgi:hypothetical protein
MKMNQAITQIQQGCSQQYCIKCHRTYPKKWYYFSQNRCFFCHTFPISRTKYDMLQDMEWQWIRSGDSNRKEYYQEYIEYLSIWCTAFHIISDKKDQQLEAEIRYMIEWE